MGDVTHVTQEAVNGYQEGECMAPATRSGANGSGQSQQPPPEYEDVPDRGGKQSPGNAAGLPGLWRYHRIYAESVDSRHHDHRQLYHLSCCFRYVSQPIRRIEINSDIQKGIAAAESIFEIWILSRKWIMAA